CLVAVGLPIFGEGWVGFGGVGGGGEGDGRLLEILIGFGGGGAAAGSLVAGDGGRPAGGGGGVGIGGGGAELHEVTEGVDLFRYQLAGGNDAKRVAAVARLGGAEPFHHSLERFVPPDLGEFAVLAKQRAAEPVLRTDGVVFGESLGAELASVHRM